jgi:Family of unknown function (DUF6519)
MKNDITRDTFDRTRHFSRVLLQQGRVQIDADFNEEASILLDYLRVLTADLIGPAAGPENACGFGLFCCDDDFNALTLSVDDRKKATKLRKEKKVLIGPGRYYVDGLLSENDEFSELDPAVIAGFTRTKKPVLIYLDVWERLITAVEDDSIREKALGGPDTATRAKIEWSVKALPLSDVFRKPDLSWVPAPAGAILANARKSLGSQFAAWSTNQSSNRPLLRARIDNDSAVGAQESGYRGLENQLYRVEIHRGGAGHGGSTPGNGATFKWSRDNGSVVAAWLGSAADGSLKIAGIPGHEEGFAKGQWVELSDDQHDLDGICGTLVQVKDTQPGSLTIDPETARGSKLAYADFRGGHPKVRRWDQEENEKTSLVAGAIAIEYDKWFTLEEGVQVQFPAPTVGPNSLPPDQPQFRTGDYWMIPARTATRDIEWPWETDARKTRRALPPRGIEHHYALLGVLAADGDKVAFTDLRTRFTPIPLAR